MDLPLEHFWLEILSRDPIRISDARRSLSAEEQEALVAHLRRLVADDGWTDPQRVSALIALKVLIPQDVDR
jgi:hypothetical protein